MAADKVIRPAPSVGVLFDRVLPVLPPCNCGSMFPERIHLSSCPRYFNPERYRK